MLRYTSTLAAAFVSVIASAQTICIDPGHPSENGVGTHGKHISEMHAAWEVARKLSGILRADGYTVVMTKSREAEKVTNKRRAEIANAAHADLFIRLHCDAGTSPGFATYYPGGVGKVGRVSGPSAKVLAESKAAAEKFHPAAIRQMGKKVSDRGLHTEMATMIGSKQGALTGSIYSKVPVILIEMAVLQNKHDDAFIATDEGQDVIAQGIGVGIFAAVPAKPRLVR